MWNLQPWRVNPAQARARVDQLRRKGPGGRKPGDRHRLGGAILGLLIGSIAGGLIGSLLFGVFGAVLGVVGGTVIGSLVGTRLGYIAWKRQNPVDSPPSPPDDSSLIT